MTHAEYRRLTLTDSRRRENDLAALRVAASQTGARVVRVTEADTATQAKAGVGRDAWELVTTPSRYPLESLTRHGIDRLPWEQVGYSEPR